MKKELIDQVTEGFIELIKEQLATDSAIRFRRAEQLCNQAHQLLQMNAMRVGDVDAEESLGIDMPGGGFHIGGRIAGPIIRPTGSDLGDTLRELMHTIGPTLISKGAQSEETRLAKLLSIRKRLEEANRPTDTIDARIDAVLEDFNKEKTHGTGVDDSIVLRRLASGSDRSDDDAADRGEGDGVGEGGAREVTDVCA